MTVESPESPWTAYLCRFLCREVNYLFKCPAHPPPCFFLLYAAEPNSKGVGMLMC